MLTLAGQVELTTDAAVGLLEEYPRLTIDVYDFGVGSSPNTITAEDIGRLLVIEPLSQRVALRLLEAGGAAPWGLVPIDARLEDADPEGDLYWEAGRLYAYFDAIHEVGDAIASKLLHLKRPSFFPILDSWIRDLYGGAAAEACAASARARTEAPRATRLYWAAVRSDLANRQNQDAIREIRSTLLTSSRVPELATVSAVRLIDMVAWRWLERAASENAEEARTGSSDD